MTSRFIGGVLLIVGTSIGGGMLALPVANAGTGFGRSVFFLIGCWAIMTLGAFFILEANLYLPRGKHMVSMADATLGKPGLLTAWLSYLLLLYSLLCAYISGGSDMLGSLTSLSGFTLKSAQSALIFTVSMGLIVSGGIRKVDWVNRGLMFFKLGIYVILVICITPRVHPQYLAGGHWQAMAGNILILITSFGFAIIVPDLREYFNDDIAKLKKVIWIGSLIPLGCYIAWNAVILGSIPATDMQALFNDPHTTSQLAITLSHTLDNSFISRLFNAFTAVCMLTAFLGVSLCLMSFLADGLNLSVQRHDKKVLFCLTFIPPLMLVLYYPDAYLYALNYAGFFCVILLLLLPALMVLFGRKKFTSRYQVPGGRFAPVITLVVSCLLLLNAWKMA